MTIALFMLGEMRAVGQCNPCSFGSVSGTSAASFGATVSANYATGLGNAANVSGAESVGAGSLSVSGLRSLGLSYKGAISGDTAVGIGHYINVSGDGSYIFGRGITDGVTLNNSLNNTLMFGMNSNLPTMTITDAGGTSGAIGNVGIGTDAPTCRLHAVAKPNTGGSANIMRLGIEGIAAPMFVQVANLAQSTTEFAPYIQGTTNSTTLAGFTFRGQVLDENYDTGSDPVVNFQVRRYSSNTADKRILDRPLFQFTNNATPIISILPSSVTPDEGNVGIGTTTPKNRLDVEGSLAVGASYSGSTPSAPTNGAIIQGNVGIGTNAPNEKLHVAGKVRINTFGVGGSAVGFDASNNLTDLSGSSERFKDNIQPLQFDKGAFLSILPISFNWKSAYGGSWDAGFKAQQVAEVFPELADIRYKHSILDDGTIVRDSLGLPIVDSTLTEPFGVKYHKFPVYLFQLAKYQDSVIQAMGQRMDAMQAQIEECCARPDKRMGDSNATEGNEKARSSAHTECVLLQNDPNPFFDFTDIRLSIPASAKNASLLIVDMKGTVVLNVSLNDRQETIRVYSSEIGKGIFTYYLLSEGNVVASRKMVSTK